MNVRSVGVGRVGVCMLCTCVSEEGVGGKNAGSESLSLHTLPSPSSFSFFFNFFLDNAAFSGLDELFEHFVLDGSIWCNRLVPLRLYPRQGQKRSFIRLRIHISVRCQVSASAWSGREIGEAKRRRASAIITAGESVQKKLCFLCCGAASLGAARRW